MNDNVVQFGSSTLAPSAHDVQSKLDARTLENIVETSARLSEALGHVADTLAVMDRRIRFLELAHNKAEREKVTNTAIYNPQGKRVI